MAGGRPTDYTTKTPSKVDEYIEACAKENVLPQTAGLALYLDVSRKTLYNWAKDHDEFLHKLEKLLSTQENLLIAFGLNGKYNPTITKLILAKHDYYDKTDVTSDGKAIEHKTIIGTLDKVYGATGEVSTDS